MFFQSVLIIDGLRITCPRWPADQSCRYYLSPLVSPDIVEVDSMEVIRNAKDKTAVGGPYHTVDVCGLWKLVSLLRRNVGNVDARGRLLLAFHRRHRNGHRFSVRQPMRVKLR